jgi:predicted RNA binding protein with dsRBD fold (UPF0201 family)
MIVLTAQTEIFPSESPDKIKAALTHIADFTEFTESPPDADQVRLLTARATGVHSLQKLFKQVRKQRTVQATRNFVMNLVGNHAKSVRFMIHKQFLTMGRIAVCGLEEESPLGPVMLTIQADNLPRVLEYLFPPTEDGHVLEVDYIPDE